MVKEIRFIPKNYIGVGALEQIKDELHKLSVRNLLIISDPTLMEIGVIDKLKGFIEANVRKIDIFYEVEPEPSLELAERLINYSKENKYDGIIGIGGGSSLDLAKIAAVLSVHDGKVEDYLNLTGTKTIQKRGLPKILIPTTSGTGSEVTDITVLSLENSKDVITHDFLLADVTIIDPELTLSLPKNVTAASGMDALTHAIEAYLSNQASSVSDALAIHATKLIGESLTKAVTNGDDLSARIKMSEASYIAGISFYNAGVAGVHALAYPLGGQYNIPHGAANAVLLPYVMDYIKSSCRSRISTLTKILSEAMNEELQEPHDEHFIQLLLTLTKRVQLPTTIKEYGIEHDALKSLTDDAIKQTRLLARSPMTLKHDDIFNIYEAAWKGTINGKEV